MTKAKKLHRTPALILTIASFSLLVFGIGLGSVVSQIPQSVSPQAEPYKTSPDEEARPTVTPTPTLFLNR